MENTQEKKGAIPEVDSRGPIAWWMVFIHILLSIFLPVIGPIISLVTGFREKGRPGSHTIRTAGGASLTLHLLLLILLSGVYVFWLEHHNDELEIRSARNIRLVIEGVKMYGAMYGEFPETLDQLVEVGILNEIPLNPFTEEPLIDVPFGPDRIMGEFTYVRVRESDMIEGGSDKIVGFYFFSYSYTQYSREDINGDGIIDNVGYVQSSDRDSRNNPTLPPIQDLVD